MSTGPSWRSLILLSVAVLGLLVGGCAFSVQVPPTQPPAITQQLLARSLERALAQLDVTRFAGRPVTAEVHSQSGNQWFIREVVVAWLGEHGVRVVPIDSALTLKVFAPVFGTDQGQSLIGIPSFQAPVVNVVVPEIALFKWVRNRGRVEVQIYAFDATTNAFVDKTPVKIGHAKFDDFTLLLIINFSVTDIDKPPAP